MENAKSSTRLLEPGLLVKLERLALATRRMQTGLSRGERRSRRRGASIEFADYRDYVQGDDLRHIDWNIYARLGNLYLKLFEAEEDLTLHLLIDASRSMAFGSPPKIEFAKKLAAAIGYIGLVGYDRVSVEAFAGDRRENLRPCRGRVSSRKLFSFLDSIECEGGTNLDGSCRAYSKRNRASGVTLMISDFMDESGFENSLKRLAGTNTDVYAITVLATEEMAPRLSGDLKLIDSETADMAEISVSRVLLKRYAERLDGFLESIREFCASRGISHFVVSSDTPIEELTLNVLRKGGMVK